ncbi:MAG TPA: thiamine pyrophosphate-dependent enzyme [Gaiellaceae bacterium]|nr:thiamine pyrophosphate-dependent enzyme [Gaiellaceae bacterium]
MARTVRDAALDVFRRRGLTTMFANPGSTEIPFLTGLPGDLRFVLGLHEVAVVGMASGYAIGRGGEPALVLLHTTAGLGTAVGALATARVNRAPLVVVVGQQDRRHLSFEPFLAGRLRSLAGEYPVRVEEPAQAQDVPAAIERAYHAAATLHGPALVIVPMDDWEAPADEEREPAAASGPLLRPTGSDSQAVDALAAFLAEATTPAIVVGAGADDPETWAALVELAERLVAPVYQEAFGARAGFPQDHRLFAGVLPSARARLRELLAPHDALLVVGASVFRQTAYMAGRFTQPGTRIAVVGGDGEEVFRSPAELTVLAPPGPVTRALADRVPPRDTDPPDEVRRPPSPPPPAPGEPLTASHVLAALAERLPRNAIVLEEAPVDRPDIHARLPAREPLGYLSAAHGGLGFAVPAAVGLRLASADRPVVAVVGDGSALYGVHALWSAVHYGAGPLVVVLSNGGYVVMDRLAEKHSGTTGPFPWPSFGDVELATIARGFASPAHRITTHDELVAQLDDVVPTLAHRDQPLLLDVVVAPTPTFAA